MSGPGQDGQPLIGPNPGMKKGPAMRGLFGLGHRHAVAGKVGDQPSLW